MIPLRINSSNKNTKLNKDKEEIPNNCANATKNNQKIIEKNSFQKKLQRMLSLRKIEGYGVKDNQILGNTHHFRSLNILKKDKTEKPPKTIIPYAP